MLEIAVSRERSPLVDPRQLRLKSKEDYLSILTTSIDTPQNAAKYLDRNDLIDCSAPPSVDILTRGLLWVANQIATSESDSVQLLDTLCAFAFYAEATQQVQKTPDAPPSLEGSTQQSISGALLSNVLERLEMIEKKISDSSNLNSGAYSPPSPSSSPSTSPRQSNPVCPPSALSKEISKNREVIIEGLLKEDDPMSRLQESDLIEKCTHAMMSMRQQNPTVPHHLSFICARKLCNHSVVLELDSSTSVQWLTATPECSNIFAKLLGRNVVIRPQTFSCFVEFVPTSFDPNSGDIDRVEKHNTLPSGCISDTKWVKNPIRRSQGQLEAHLIINFKTAEAANRSIHEGLIINGKKVNSKRRKPAVIRCLKCQKLGHIAAKCDSDHDVCMYCAERHKSNSCTHRDDPQRYRCVNCDSTDHAVWERACPAVIEAERHLLESSISSRIKYFATEDPATWEVTGELYAASPKDTQMCPSSTNLGGGVIHRQSYSDWNTVNYKKPRRVESPR